MPAVSETKYLVKAGWDDAPHLSEEQKSKMLSHTPPHLRQARREGTPTTGIGRIYPLAWELVKCDPFPIPPKWPKAYAIDPSWQRTAALFGAHDPQGDIIYFYGEYYEEEMRPDQHVLALNPRGAGWMRGVSDPAAAGSSQSDGKKLLTLYRQAGLKLATAENPVESGLAAVWSRLSQRRIRVFSTLESFKYEYNQYHRNDKGKIVKRNDHLMDCFGPDTEVLAVRGWIPFERLEQDDILLSANLATDELEYQRQSAPITERRHDGELVRIGGRKLDALVTPGHRMVVYERGREEPSIRLAGELRAWDRVKLHSAGFPGACPDEVRVGDCMVRATDMAAFLGWYAASGSLLAERRVSISQNRGRDDLESLLKRLPWDFSHGGTYQAASGDLWNYLRSDAGSGHLSKFVPVWVRRAGRRVIEAFVDAAVAGGGRVREGRRNLSTESRRLADEMQELFIKLGKSASVRRVADPGGRVRFWVSEWNCPHGLLRDSENEPNFERVPYSGKVYCATVPNGTLIVRRNGKPMITGNCMRYWVMTGIRVAATKEELVRPAGGYRGSSVADERAGF